ncbi:MAG: sensor signal transduction histidine kinase [Bryobacterales bacterium]|nr:sensor signal transduction histidine kinase [Bryobacterales bacterium]
MAKDLRFQLSTALLTVVSVAAAIAAVLNYQQLHRFPLPDDGAVWRERNGRVVAARVAEGGPADRAGIRVNDTLQTIQSVPISSAEDVARRLAAFGAWARATYVVRRAGVNDVKATVIIGEAARGVAYTYQYLVGAFYLAIGLFIYFRRGSAVKARHFYIFCLVSFIFSCFHYTGKLNAFDQVMYWGNVIAGWLAPALFLHFALTFPEPAKWYRRGMATACYMPGIVLTVLYASFATGLVITPGTSLPEVRELLDRMWMGLITLNWTVSCLVLQRGYRRAEDPVIRQQLKWLRNGLLFGFAPFGLLYAVPYVLNLQASPLLNYSVLTLPLIPLTIAWSILRYRLMDVDVIFRRGYAYTLATLIILATFYGIVFTIGNMIQKNVKDVSSSQLIFVMLIATFLFQPIRNWIQERLDRHFYRDAYDYRKTLVDFVRELNSTEGIDHMLQSVADRLMQTLSIRHVAFFFSEPGSHDTKWKLRASMGSSGRPLTGATNLDLSFLNWDRPTQPYLFFERTRYHLDVIASNWAPPIRQTIADLDLNYYLPCMVRGRTVAFLGVSRTETGEFLSTEDLELLLTLANYVGIAIENADLYRSLSEKAGEYERLKEFSENIVESINVGILAVGLDDRVESWNAQMERLSGIGREDATGRTLTELLPAPLVEELDKTRNEVRIHHLYKFTFDAAEGEATVNIAITPLVSREMEQIGRLVIFDDITHRAELERRLVQADKLSSIGLLAAGVAHEVNTPLAVISTYAQMLAKQVAGDEQKSRMLDKISKQTFRASEIVNSLLNFSRSSGTELGGVQMNAVITETLSLLEHQMRKAGIEVVADLSTALPLVKGNAGKLQQVFLNLFINARDAMEPKGKLEIITRESGQMVEIDVMDSGHGIAAEHLSMIYDPFFTTKGAGRGTGLGLSVTYGIIQEHGGHIEARSRENGGTCFHLTFPIAAAAPAKPVELPVQAIEPTGSVNAAVTA